MFCKNELFWTPLFDTLPLDAVVGRCLVLEPSIWCKGRPRLPKYREDDIFICEYRVDKSQRFFEKIAQKNRYYINTERYIFDHYEERLRIKRNFTPFIMPGGTGEHPVKVVAESDDEDLVPLGVIRLNLQKRKRAQMMQRLENIVQSINQQTTRDDI
uniref:BAH domain-containing protein n=1 Tax=Plectus sambesii TaxID=2011161 RepID=A0A914UIY7_9BILA